MLEAFVCSGVLLELQVALSQVKPDGTFAMNSEDAHLATRENGNAVRAEVVLELGVIRERSLGIEPEVASSILERLLGPLEVHLVLAYQAEEVVRSRKKWVVV